MAEEKKKHDNSRFFEHEVTTVVNSAIEATLAGKVYNYDQANPWSADILQRSINMLKNYKKPYKYVVTVTIIEKNGAGLHQGSVLYWKDEADGRATICWENDTMLCLVNVYGVGIV